MLFNLIYDKKNQLCFYKDTPKEAGDYIKEQIAGDGKWKHLKGINPSECKLRVDKIISNYYDLDGNFINEEKIS